MSKIMYLIPKRSQKSLLNNIEPLELIDVDLIEIPILGWTSAGQPIQMEIDYDTINVPISMVKKETFALRVKGNSMVEENIKNGDIVIIEKRNSAENGETVIVKINDSKVTMKKLYIEPKGIRLQPANKQMSAIYIKNEQIEILGIVTGIMRQP